jgi:hypothetical protein
MMSRAGEKEVACRHRYRGHALEQSGGEAQGLDWGWASGGDEDGLRQDGAGESGEA